MTNRPNELRELEGRHICVALDDGSRIDDCELVSAGRGPSRTLWIFAQGDDAFIPLTNVVEVWPAAPRRRLQAA